MHLSLQGRFPAPSGPTIPDPLRTDRKCSANSIPSGLGHQHVLGTFPGGLSFAGARPRIVVYPRFESNHYFLFGLLARASTPPGSSGARETCPFFLN